MFHSISFYCDDINKTVRDLKTRGVDFTSGVTDEGWGLLTHFRMPGGLEVELYEPKYVKRARAKSLSPQTTLRRKAKTERKSAGT